MTTSIRLKNTSRYLKTRILVDETTGYLFFHIWKPLEISNQDDDKVLRLPDAILGRWDTWAYNYLSNPEIWWITPHQNKIEDPFAMPDFSDADDQLEYPKYFLEGWEDKITYPVVVNYSRKQFFNYGENPSYRFIGELDHPPMPGSFSFTDLRSSGTRETFTDNGMGELTGDQGGNGTISYPELTFKVEYVTPPAHKTLLVATYNYATLPKGTHNPQFESAERLRVPSRENVRNVMLDAQS